MTSKKGKRTKVAIYLLKDGRNNPGDFLVEERKGVELANIGTLFKVQIQNDTPSWVDPFFQDIDAIKGLHRSGAGAILHLKAKIDNEEKGFLVCFGYGYHHVNTGACVEQFGLKVAINSGNLQKIRSLDKRNLSSTPKLSREQLALQESIQSFTVDVEQDMMQGMTLASLDGEFGKTVSGALGISFTTSHTAKTIKEVLPKLYDYYISERYKEEKYDWIDNIKPVTARSIIADLDEQLVKQLNLYSKDNQNVVLSPPEILEWDGVRGFSPRPKNESLIDDEINLEDYLKKDDHGDVIELENISSVKDARVHKWDAATDSVTQHWSLYRCITGDIEYNSKRYVLSDGKWYEINQEFADKVDAWFSGVDKNNLGFPLYTKVDKTDKNGKQVRVHDEGEYNKKLVSQGYDLLDKNLVHIAQYKDIEACDVFKDKDFVHIKIFTGASAPISHLLAQASVSSDLFFGDMDFRKAMNEKLKTNKLTSGEIKKPKNADYTITLAIVTNKPYLHLPFFSKVNLRATMHRFNVMGVNSRVAYIKGDFS